MPAIVKKPFRHAVFVAATRARLVARLVQDQGLSRSEARELAQSVTEDVIEEAAKTVTAEDPPKVGAGGILAFLLEFIQSPLFAQIIELLLGLFSAPVATRGPA